MPKNNKSESSRRRRPIAVKKTLHERETELQLLLATAVGQEELRKMAAKYYAASGRLMPASGSPITYILVHERERGLIRG
jgi:hypothetical protein